MKHWTFFLLFCGGALTAHAQSTAFTYQGRLAANGAPYTGFAEMQFALFNRATGGVVVATSTPAVASVNVSSGLFTVLLDFGAAAFPGEDRWLEIQLRTNLGPFITLSPRQPVTPTPYALFARTAGTVTNNSVTAASIASGQVVKSLNGLRDVVNVTAGTNVTIRTNGNNLTLSAGPWSPNGSSTFYNGGNVGIGTNNPFGKLQVSGGSAIFDYPDGPIRITKTGGALSAEDLTLWNKGGSGSQPFAITGWNNDNGIYINTSDGNVGIGTGASLPQARLEVRGNVKLGSSGQLFAPGGEENLRIVRGVIGESGNIIAGSGFTVIHDVIGRYTVTFNTPFSVTPASTAVSDYSTFLGTEPVTVMVVGPSASTVPLFLKKPNGDSIDARFHFIAIGPR